MVYQLFKQHVDQRPGAVALVQDDESVSYAQFDEAIRASLGYLRRVYRGGVIATCLDNSIYNLQVLYAAALLEAPVCTLDPTQTAHELQQILDDCTPSLIITQPQFEQRVQAALQMSRAGAQVISERVLGKPVAPADLPVRSAADALLDRGTSPDFLIQYTSGSTGRPKGVVQSQRGMTRRLSNWIATVGIDAACSHLCILPLSHGYGNYCVALPALSSGGALHLMNLKKVSPKAVARYIHARRITCFYALPFFYRLMAELPASFDADLGSLRSSMVGSAPATPEVLEMFEARFGVRLNNCYGTSEAGIITYNANADLDVPPISIGRLIQGFEHRLKGSYAVDGREVGNLSVRTGAMAERYFSGEGTVAEGSWHDTGDLVYQNEKGYFFVAGRLSLFINVSGNKVMPEEIEATILQLSEVREVGVTSLPDPLLGERIAALVVKQGDLTAADVAAHCRSRLVSYKVPTVIRFIDALPKSGVGKVQRSKLGQLLA